MSRLDPHSYADSDQPRIDHLAWQARVDFAQHVLHCQATLRFSEPSAAAGPLDLDTRDLAIERVETEDGQSLAFKLHAAEPILGARLTVQLTAGVAGIRVHYQTSSDATALQWLEPAQTAGGHRPFLYSQCQAIHARSVVPLQDTPRHRLRYEAALLIPNDQQAVMAAEPLDRVTDGATARCTFRMPQPIAPYLFAFAVGDLQSRDIGPRSRVWAEPSVVEGAAWEFAETEAMLATGERLFGPYDWDRYDILVLPPSFPYGGMENPRLTFLTPTLLAGDRSQVAVVAHELAHSWTGNLVSNANAEHFWLNEGFTTYAERRIVEAVYGPDTAALEWALGRRSLDESLRLFEADHHPELTRLRTELAGVDPDDAYSTVPYEKGALFLLTLEQQAGREAFDAYLQRYLQRFRFEALTTEEWASFTDNALPGVFDQVDAQAWLYEPGLPANAPGPTFTQLERIQALGGAMPSDEQAAAWSAPEWQLYVESLPRTMDEATLAELDRRFHLTESRNYEILVGWLSAAARAGYTPALGRTEVVLSEVGRMKYLKPLYRELAGQPETRALARSLFVRFSNRYHPIARQGLAQLLDQHASPI